jgi:Zn ribbon nucleic-acid-binding protein
MSRKRLFLCGVIFILLATAPPVMAQQSEYTLGVHRDNGYGGGDQIRGSFTVDIYPAANIQQVTFLIDGKVMAEVKAEPFKFSFKTDDYGIGWHDLSAVVLTLDGRSVTTSSRRFEFVSAEVEMQAVGKILGIVGGALAGVAIIVVLLNVLIFRKRPKRTLPMGAARKFGIAGGAICPNCKRAFSRHWWAPNVGLSKYDRCDYCGKWSRVRAASPQELDAAIKAELEGSQPEVQPAQTEEEKLKEMLDKSRYMD